MNMHNGLTENLVEIRALADQLYADGVLNFRQYQAYVTNAEYAAESDNMTDLEDLLADLKDTFVK